MSKYRKMKALATTGATAIYLGLMNAQVVLAADGGEVKSKLTSAGKTIQGILTGLDKISKNLSNYEINFNYSEDLSNVINAIGGGPRLIKNNQIEITSQQEKFQPDIAQGKAPRTAVALLKNGNILLITVDGRQLSSRGMTLEELAYFLKDYDSKDAMNFDGGGSTAMYFNGSLINSISDPKERKVSNGLFLFEN